MQSNFKFTQKNTLKNSGNASNFFSSLNVNFPFFDKASFIIHVDNSIIGVFPCKLNEVNASSFNNVENFLDLIILVNKSSNLSLSVKKPLINLFQEIFISPYFPDKEEFVKVLKTGKFAVASFGQSKSTFKIDEAIRNALRDASKSLDITLAKSAFLHIQFNHFLSSSELYRGIEILREALNNQEAPICCSFKLIKSNFLKSFLILNGFKAIKELKNNNFLSHLLFDLEPESTSNENKLNLTLELPNID
ncbi:MAG: hypothetical protein QW476_01315 [Candidatus Bathyarchaeia archaeon]|nr:hypothetical protein [Candidatus Bathyarchaeota archaeon]